MSLSRIVSGGFGGAVYRTLDCLRRSSGAGGFAGQSSPQARELHAAAQGRVSTLLKSLGTSLDGLSSDEVRRRRRSSRAQRGGPRATPKVACPDPQGVQNPFIALLAPLGAVPLLDARVEDRFDHRGHGAHQCAPSLCPGVPLDTCGGTTQGQVQNTAMVTRIEVHRPGYGPRTWEAVRLLAKHGEREVPRHRQARPGRHRPPLGRRHCPCRREAGTLQGPFR